MATSVINDNKIDDNINIRLVRVSLYEQGIEGCALRGCVDGDEGGDGEVEGDEDRLKTGFERGE